MPAATAPKEPTIMELLEQNWQKQHEKERQQSMLPESFGTQYSSQGMSRTAMPANYNQPAQVAAEQQDN